MRPVRTAVIWLLILGCPIPPIIFGQDLQNTKVDGYRGIWFELNQKYPHGDKYSGGLGTYTAKHVPLAVFAPKAQKTFFVYGGTTNSQERHLLCMIGEYDHQTHTVTKPTVVCDKMGVDDPHDNPSILIDNRGYIWVFVSGRGNTRPGYKFRSTEPYDIGAFEKVSEETFTYPQIWKSRKGFFHLFTKYTGVRQLYFEHSRNGNKWSKDRLLAAIPSGPGERSGHYQTSSCHRSRIIGTFFNRHLDGHPDTRTDLYFAQTGNGGKTWTDAAGNRLQVPIAIIDHPARVIDYHSQGKNVYMKDMGYDERGFPVCLYLRSGGHEPGPENAPYEWCLTHWNGRDWITTVITTSDHNYDMGSLFLTPGHWRVAGPTGTGPQSYGVGGEISIWASRDNGHTWIQERQLTRDSRYNHAYVRRPLQYRHPFCFFWADGHPHEFSRSQLYFGDFSGNVYRLPYEMKKDRQTPEKIASGTP